MSQRLRRRYARLSLLRVFEHPTAIWMRAMRRDRGYGVWRLCTRRWRDFYLDSVADWKVT